MRSVLMLDFQTQTKVELHNLKKNKNQPGNKMLLQFKMWFKIIIK